MSHPGRFPLHHFISGRWEQAAGSLEKGMHPTILIFPETKWVGIDDLCVTPIHLIFGYQILDVWNLPFRAIAGFLEPRTDEKKATCNPAVIASKGSGKRTSAATPVLVLSDEDHDSSNPKKDRKVKAY